MTKFRVNFGSYHHKGVMYGPGFPGGIVVDSEVDLVKRYGDEKFSYVDGDRIVMSRPIGDDGLASLSLEQLQAFAEKEKIDLGDSVEKDQIVRAIRLHIYDLSEAVA